jgi:hypothetical protein
MWERIRSWFAWKDIRDSGVWLYQENTITGSRRAIRLSRTWQPLDVEWLEQGNTDAYDWRFDHL